MWVCDKVCVKSQCWDNWIATCKGKKLDSYFIPHTTIYKKWNKDPNIRSKTTILLTNIGRNIHDLGFGKVFLDMTPKAKTAKKDILDFTKLINFVHQRTPSRKETHPLESLCTTGGHVKSFCLYGKQYGSSSEIIQVLYDPAIPLLGIYPKEFKTWTDICIFVHRMIIHNSQNVEAT